MAGDPGALVLAGLGVRVLSMVHANLASVRRAIRSAVQGDLERVAIASLRDASAADVRLRLRKLA
jgi:signal transduction protein with GAF and PtsI domain